MNKLSTNTRYRMKSLGLTQRELAKKANISQVTVHKIISGKIRHTSRIVELAKALECTPDWLINGNIEFLHTEDQKVLLPNVTYPTKSSNDQATTQAIQEPSGEGSIAQRVANARAVMGITQAELARRSGISQQALQQIEKGSTQSPRRLVDLAKALNTTPERLLFGVPSSFNPVDPVFHTAKRPVIDPVMAASWHENYEQLKGSQVFEWEDVPSTASEYAFWLKVVGDSMASQTGLSIIEGMMILVEPRRSAKNGQLVIAKLEGSEEVTFKKLVVDAGMKFLKPLNTSYPTITIQDNCQIVGIVVEAKMKF